VPEKIVYAGVVSRSYQEAGALVRRLAELPVPDKQVERLTRRIGGERVAERDADVKAFQELPLAEKFGAPAGVTPPDLAVVMVDGGRLRIPDRGPPSAPPEAAAADAAAEVWEEEAAAKAGHWREDKVGLPVTMDGVVSEHDPCPEIPASFPDACRMPRLVRELKAGVKGAEDAAADADEPEVADQALREEAKYQPPEVVRRRVAASRVAWPAFAPPAATPAWTLGFQGASRKAFVGDGSANDWKLRRRFFGSFVPILDFIHALSYVFAAAMAGRKFGVGWACYREWIAWVWQGQVARVIAALDVRQRELGLPTKDEPETSPRQVVARTRTYLRNHADKMRYDEYRRQGLPIGSSLMESMVKQINRRVKGTEKFWSEEGSEAVLQPRADHLSDGEPLQAFWQRRQATATGQRRYRRAV